MLAPLSTLWQVVFDMSLFGARYTLIQYIGLVILFLIYIFQGVKFALYDLPKAKKREAAKIAEVLRIEAATRDGIKFLDDDDAGLEDGNSIIMQVTKHG